VDIYPTLCELAGIAAPKDLDGASFAGVLKHPTVEPKKAVFHVYPRGKRIGRAVRTDRHRLVEWKVPGAPADTAELELYDYVADPTETSNLVSQQPEKVAELRAILAREPEARPQIVANSATATRGISLVDLDLTKGPPNDKRVRVEGGRWDNGWRVVGDLDRIFIDLDRDVKNGYFEVVVTRKGEFAFPERKRNWMGLSAVECMHQAAGGYARAGDLMYDFSKAEIFASTQSNTIREVKFGKPTDWVLDDKTPHVVRAEMKNKVMTWTTDKGGKAEAGSDDQPVNYFRFAAVGGILDHKTGWHHGSLIGLRVMRITIVDYEQPAKTPTAK
jgi:hypothetical protein